MAETRRLDVTSFEIEGFQDGSVKVTSWCKCWSPEAIDDAIEWLKLGRIVMERWAEIRETKP
jgi:hypothetical protein